MSEEKTPEIALHERILEAVRVYELELHRERRRSLQRVLTPSAVFGRCKELLGALDPELRAAVVTDLRVWLARCASERTGTPPCSCKGTVNILWSPKHKDPEQLLVCAGCAESLTNEHPDYVRLM